jgi:hypothetical protein
MPKDGPVLRKSQFSILGAMAAVAVIALAMVLCREASSPGDAVARCLMALLFGFLLLHLLIGSILGYPCPACSRWALRRLARHRHYYRCSSCRARVKRYGLGPWEDASGPKDAPKFCRDTHAGTWMGFEWPGEPGDSTSGQLLADRRSRGGPGEGLWHPPVPGSPRRSEEARRKVRAALDHLREIRE